MLLQRHQNSILLQITTKTTDLRAFCYHFDNILLSVNITIKIPYSSSFNLIDSLLTTI